MSGNQWKERQIRVHWRGKSILPVWFFTMTGPSFTSYVVMLEHTCRFTEIQSYLTICSENILADVNAVVQASTMNPKQMVNDFERGPAFKVALVYSLLLSGSPSMSTEKSMIFTFFSDLIDLFPLSSVLVNVFFPNFCAPMVVGTLVIGSAESRCPET